MNTDQFILLEVLSGPTILGSWTKIDDSLTNSITSMAEHSHHELGCQLVSEKISIGFPCQSSFILLFFFFLFFFFGGGWGWESVKSVG